MLYTFLKYIFYFLFFVSGPYVAAPLDEDFLKRQLWNIHIPESNFLLLDIINFVLLSVWDTCKLTDIVMYTTLVISVESSVSPFCSYQRCVAQLLAQTKQGFRYYDAFLSQSARIIRNVGYPSHSRYFCAVQTW